MDYRYYIIAVWLVCGILAYGAFKESLRNTARRLNKGQIYFHEFFAWHYFMAGIGGLAAMIIGYWTESKENRWEWWRLTFRMPPDLIHQPTFWQVFKNNFKRS